MTSNLYISGTATIWICCASSYSPTFLVVFSALASIFLEKYLWSNTAVFPDARIALTFGTVLFSCPVVSGSSEHNIVVVCAGQRGRGMVFSSKAEDSEAEGDQEQSDLGHEWCQWGQQG